MSIEIGSKYTNNRTGEECTVNNSRRRGKGHTITIVYGRLNYGITLAKKYFLRNYTPVNK